MPLSEVIRADTAHEQHNYSRSSQLEQRHAGEASSQERLHSEKVPGKHRQQGNMGTCQGDNSGFVHCSPSATIRLQQCCVQVQQHENPLEGASADV